MINLEKFKQVRSQTLRSSPLIVMDPTIASLNLIPRVLCFHSPEEENDLRDEVDSGFYFHLDGY